MKNKILAGILAVSLAGGVGTVPENIAPVVSMAESAEGVYIYENLTYRFLEDGTIEIIGCDESATEVVIPEVIDRVKVTSIGNSAFSRCSSLTSIEISQNATSIGSWAFDATPWLEAKRAENPLVIVNNIVIDGRACSGDVIIPGGVICIGNDAFSDSTLTSITIPDSVTSIGYNAFSFCRNLESIIIPYSVTEIKTGIPYWSTLKSITVLNPKCNIDDNGFAIGEGAASMLFIDTIYGYENSTAQAYAEKHNCNFVSLGKAPEENTPTGNINGDNEFNISDLVLLQKYLLGMPDTKISDWKQADLYSDGVLDIFDLCMMRKKLIEK